MDIQIINMIRLKICFQESIWISNQPQITTLQQLKDKITFEHVKQYNDNLVESLEEEEKWNAENQDRKKVYYKTMLQFVYKRRKILESEDLRDKLPQGVFEDQQVNVSFKQFLNMKEEFIVRDNRLLKDMMFNVFSVVEAENESKVQIAGQKKIWKMFKSEKKGMNRYMQVL